MNKRNKRNLQGTILKAGFVVFFFITITTSILAQTGKTVWGAESGKFPGEKMDGIESWKRLNDRIKAANGGYPLTARRSYDKGFPATWDSSAMAPDAKLCKISAYSFKPSWIETAKGTNHDALRKFINSIPDNQTVYLIFHHEPEDDLDSLHTIPDLQKAFAQFVDVVLASGKKNVYPAFCLMTYTFKPESRRNPEDYNFARFLKPGQAGQVVAGLDGYGRKLSMSAKDVFEPALNQMKSWGFRRFGIFEVSAHDGPNPTDRQEWIKGLGNWVKTQPEMELVLWFNSSVGPQAGNKGWFLGTWEQNGNDVSCGDADGTIAAYAELAKQNGKK